MHNYCGIVLTLIGIGFVGYSAAVNIPKGLDEGDVKLGLICMLISLVINAVYFISEEQIIKDYYIEPLKLIGIEGLIGLGLASLLMVPLNFISCENSHIDITICDDDKLENTIDYFYTIF